MCLRPIAAGTLRALVFAVAIACDDRPSGPSRTTPPGGSVPPIAQRLEPPQGVRLAPGASATVTAAVDPDERKNRLSARPQVAAAIARRLKVMAGEDTPLPAARIGPENDKALRALGYVGTNVQQASKAAGSLPDAKDFIATHNVMVRQPPPPVPPRCPDRN